MIYKDWGFRENPFQVTALPPTQLGSELLIGRDRLVEGVCTRLRNPPRIVTIEGPNGAGKTSIANVASYRIFEESLASKGDSLFIPCQAIFQISPEDDYLEFRYRVLLEVAQALISHSSNLPVEPGRTGSYRNKAINRWINSAESKSFSLTIADLIGFGAGAQPTDSEGFINSGFEKSVTNWLSSVFPSANSGGVVCIIDNLEILRTSANARFKLERMRDDLLSMPGLKWILCGSLGIVNGVASSPRLSGHFFSPIEVSGFPTFAVEDLLKSRIRAYARRSDSFFLPIDVEILHQIFELFRGNLRTCLMYCDEYCLFIRENFEKIQGIDHNIFNDWKEEIMEKSFSAIRGEISKKALSIFRQACELRVFSFRDRQKFGMITEHELQFHVRELADEGLLTVSEDETDLSRKSIQVTPQGWMVHERILDIEQRRLSEEQD